MPLAFVRAAAAVTAAAAALLAVAAAPAAGQGGGPVGGPLLTGTAPVRATGTAAVPRVTARSWLVADADTGAVLAARDPHRRMRPASTLKLLTALVLLPRLDPRAWHIGTVADAAVEGSRVGIVPGVRYRVGELWRGLLMQSGNDAAHALAGEAGGVPATVAAMRQRAVDLGAFDTRVVNPSGLDAPGQVSSAYDLALVTAALLGDRSFLAYEAKQSFLFPGKPRWKRYQVQSQNRLLGRYRGVLAGKTGYTTLAGNTFVAAARRAGHRLVVVVLRPAGGHHAWAEARALLDWGFRAEARVGEPVGRLVAPGELAATARTDLSGRPVLHGRGADPAPTLAAAAGSLPVAAGPEPGEAGPARTLAWGIAPLAALGAGLAVVRSRLRRRQSAPPAG